MIHHLLLTLSHPGLDQRVSGSGQTLTSLPMTTHLGSDRPLNFLSQGGMGPQAKSFLFERAGFSPSAEGNIVFTFS